MSKTIQLQSKGIKIYIKIFPLQINSRMIIWFSKNFPYYNSRNMVSLKLSLQNSVKISISFITYMNLFTILSVNN